MKTRWFHLSIIFRLHRNCRRYFTIISYLERQKYFVRSNNNKLVLYGCAISRPLRQPLIFLLTFNSWLFHPYQLSEQLSLIIFSLFDFATKQHRICIYLGEFGRCLQEKRRESEEKRVLDKDQVIVFDSYSPTLRIRAKSSRSRI